ncbi:DUF7219 family protein [Hydrococcus rivularis]|uniref:DUF7219 family protein n=1 Tax=Hydrococcus rivularis TaxID=1616834 RepID=UPI003CCBBFE6
MSFYSCYRSEIEPKHLIFNANCGEFSQGVGYICNLETVGKIAAEQGYQNINILWKQLSALKTKLELEGFAHNKNFF